MSVDRGAELDFLDPVGVLMLLGFLFALGLFITVLAVINQAADRRRGIWCDFDEIDRFFAGQGQSVTQGQNAELLAFRSDNSNFAGTDFPVDPDEGACRGGTTRGERATQDTL